MAEVRLSEPIGALRGDLRKKGELYARMRCGKRLARGTAGSLREGMVKS